MELGIGSYTYPWAISTNDFEDRPPFTAHSLLDRAISYGLRRVQLADNLPLHELDQSSLNALQERAIANRIQIEVGAMGLIPANLLKYLEIAVHYHSPFLRIIIDDENYHPSPQQVIDVINLVLPAFRDANVVLAIENHDRFPAKVLEHIILSTDKKQIGICLDTANSLGCGEGIREVCGVLAPYTVNLHVKDFTIRRVKTKMGFIVDGAAAGSGQLPLASVLDELKKYNRCQSATLEVWSAAEASIQETLAKEERWVLQSIGYLKNIIT